MCGLFWKRLPYPEWTVWYEVGEVYEDGEVEEADPREGLPEVDCGPEDEPIGQVHTGHKHRKDEPK